MKPAGPKPGASEHGLRRLVLGLALLLMGATAATRLPLTYTPTRLFPELSLSLGLPAATATEAERTRLLGELESAIGRSGQVLSKTGEVSERNIELRVRYQPGVAIDDKARLLEALLGDLRRRLPAGAHLELTASGDSGGQLAFVVEVARADPQLLEAVRQLPGVAAAYFSGQHSAELRLELPSELRISAGELAAGLRPRLFGSLAGAYGDAPAFKAAAALEELPAGQAQVGNLGRFTSLPGEKTLAARVMGRDAELLVVDRAAGASPLRLERELAATLASAGLAGGLFLRAESRPLALLLGRLTAALVAASLLLAALHLLLFSARAAAWQLLALPLGLAAALPPLYLAGAALDVSSLPALLLAILLSPLPAALGRRGALAWLRLSFAIAAVAALPVALALLGRLGIFLGPAARVFLLAFSCAAAAQLLLPTSGPPRRRAAAAGRRLLAWARRRSGSLLLATVVGLYVSWVYFAGSLWPHAGSLQPDLGDLSLRLQLPTDTSFATTEEEVQKVERFLDGRQGHDKIERHYAIYRRGSANFFLELAEKKSPARLEYQARELELRLRSLGVSVRAEPLGGATSAPPLRFDDDDELEPETSEAARTYNILLRGDDFATVANTAAWLRTRLRQHTDTWGIELLPQWQPPQPALELRPGPFADRQRVEQAGAALAAVFRQESAAALPPLPGQSSPLLLRVVPPGTVAERRLEAPTLGAALAALRRSDQDLGRFFELKETYTAPSLQWHSGRYLVPIHFEFRGTGANWSLSRSETHATLARLPMPPGTDLVLPSLGGEPYEKRLKLLASVALLPLLLLALLAMRLDSLWLAVAALLPGLGALAAVAPLMRLHGGLDEMALLMLAAAVTGLLPLAAGAGREGRAAAAGATSGLAAGSLWATRGHRELCRVLPRVAPVVITAALVLLLAGAGLPAARTPWVAGQQAAAIALLAGAALALLVSPAVQVAAEGLLRSLRKDERARRRALADPPSWRQEGPSVLEVRSLSKRYAGGFRALRRVDLRLEPGIVGLLGPNGAGKTTLLRTLCGTLEPSRGQVYFRGIPVLPENLRAFRRRVGYLPQSFNAWDGLSAQRFLNYWADLLKLPEGEAREQEIHQALASVGLEAMAKHAVRELSGGQRRRLGIARALLGRPPILIVDEPTTGLDVEARNQLRQSLVALAEERIVIFSTHIASDIAAVSSRVLILDRGRLLFDGPPAELIAAAEGRVFERLLEEAELRPFSRRFHVTTRIREASGIRVRAVASPGQPCDGELVLPNLEEAYLARLGSAAKVRDERSWASLLDLEAWRS